jgi:protein FAM161A
MSDHGSSVFNNSCVKLPKNPKSDHPLAVYEQKYLNQLQNEVTKLNLESPDETAMKPKSSKEKDTVKSFIEFFDSIPEYDDVNHLSNREFYKKIEYLKEKQKSYNDYVRYESKFDEKNPEWLEEYKDYAKKKITDEKKKKSAIKPFCVTPILSKSPKFGKSGEDVESVTFSDKDLSLKPPSRRSVRIETPSDKLTPDGTPSELFRRPKSRLPSASSKGQDDWDNFSIDDYKLDLETQSPLQSKSAPSSPTKSKPSVGWKDNGITIPKPFEMTVRDEENKIVEELLVKPKEDKPEMFKAHSIPIESQIPLFDKIMADQERK